MRVSRPFPHRPAFPPAAPPLDITVPGHSCLLRPRGSRRADFLHCEMLLPGNLAGLAVMALVAHSPVFPTQWTFVLCEV